MPGIADQQDVASVRALRDGLQSVAELPRGLRVEAHVQRVPAYAAPIDQRMPEGDQRIGDGLLVAQSRAWDVRRCTYEEYPGPPETRS
ncbi:hypothetical protein GCM10010176_084780 [Nonomuraea spiralis]|nr:hypothetical protein GCM10010176_084780 [Nonomuraea spiralis]